MNLTEFQKATTNFVGFLQDSREDILRRAKELDKEELKKFYGYLDEMNEEEKRQEKKPHGNCRNKIDSEHYNRMTNNKPHDNTPDE